jgi:antitoxin component HigA of HigAB toxin-antitoxin module
MITTVSEYEEAMARLYALFQETLAMDSPEGVAFLALLEEVETYEKKHFPLWGDKEPLCLP